MADVRDIFSEFCIYGFNAICLHGVKLCVVYLVGLCVDVWELNYTWHVQFQKQLWGAI